MEEVSGQNSNLGLKDLDKLEAKARVENTESHFVGNQKIKKWYDKRKLNVDFYRLFSIF